jgi:hypothetical protein
MEFEGRLMKAPKKMLTKKRRKHILWKMFPVKKRKLGTPQRRDSLGENGQAEDSQEATVTKTLSELASLVAGSLEPLLKDMDDSQEGGSKGQLSLTIDDSILSERGTDEGVGGAMAGSDLGSTVAAIMHHAPVLRSRHVAVCTVSTKIKLINSHGWLFLFNGGFRLTLFFLYFSATVERPLPSNHSPGR